MNEPKFDIGLPPPEVIEPEAPKPVEREDLRTRALRKIQEDELFEKQAREAFEGFGTMVPAPITIQGYFVSDACWSVKWTSNASPLDWYIELAGDDVERPE